MTERKRKYQRDEVRKLHTTFPREDPVLDGRTCFSVLAKEKERTLNPHPDIQLKPISTKTAQIIMSYTDKG